MITKEQIISKLKAEGIDEKFADGMLFETEEALSAWVGNAKTLLVKPKDLKDYTIDELKALADKGEVRNLQSLLDKVRTDAAKGQPTPTPAPTPTPTPTTSPELAAMQAKLDELLKDKKVSERNSKISKFSEGMTDLQKKILSSYIPEDADDATMESIIKEYKNELTAAGVKDFSVGGSNDKKDGALDSDFLAGIAALKPKTE